MLCCWTNLQGALRDDPDLTRLLAVWPRLTEAMRRQLAGLAEAMTGSG